MLQLPFHMLLRWLACTGQCILSQSVLFVRCQPGYYCKKLKTVIRFWLINSIIFQLVGFDVSNAPNHLCHGHWRTAFQISSKCKSKNQNSVDCHLYIRNICRCLFLFEIYSSYMIITLYWCESPLHPVSIYRQYIWSMILWLLWFVVLRLSQYSLHLTPKYLLALLGSGWLIVWKFFFRCMFVSSQICCILSNGEVLQIIRIFIRSIRRHFYESLLFKFHYL